MELLSVAPILLLMLLSQEIYVTYATDHCDGLRELYTRCDGENWERSDNWINDSVSCCEWGGITCAKNSTTVVVEELVLRNNRLSCALSDVDFSNLTSLRTLDLSSNELTGDVPDFSNLPELVDLYLSFNELTGDVPDFSNLPKLGYLDLSSNELTGDVPDFSNLPKLGYLDLSSNELTGDVPDFSNLPKLVDLRLSSNELTGDVPDFSNLPELGYLYLSSNELTGDVPDFSNLPKLWYLDLSSNELTGDVPDFSNLTSLRTLDLSLNFLTGDIVEFGSKLLNLRVLDISSNKLEGPGPASLFELENIQSIIVKFNNLTSIDTSKVTSSKHNKNLELLDVSYNNLTSIPQSNWDYFESLKTLSFAHNRIHGQLPTSIITSTLMTLDVQFNQLDGAVVIGGGTAVIERLLLGFNEFCSVPVYDIFSSYGTTLQELSLANLSVSQSFNIPSDIQNGALRQLDLASSGFTGTLDATNPSTFPDLSYIDIRGTNMSSSIIPDWFDVSMYTSVEDNLNFQCPVYTNKEYAITIQLDPEYHHYTQCQCVQGYFGLGKECSKCSEDSTLCQCLGEDKVANCYVEDGQLKPCPVLTVNGPVTSACNSGDKPVSWFQREVNDSVVDPPATFCRTGYAGRLCSQCARGYGHNGNSCFLCSDVKDYMVVLASFVVLIILILYLLHSSSAKNPSATVTTMILHIQQMSLLLYVMPLPEYLAGFVGSVGKTFDMTYESFSSAECLWNSDGANHIASDLIFAFSWVIVVLVSSILVYLVGLYYAIINLNASAWLKRCIGLVVSLINFTVLGITESMFSALGCFDHTEHTKYLVAYPWIECSNQHWRDVVQPLAIIASVLYSVLYPLAVYCLIYYHGKHLSGLKENSSVLRVPLLEITDDANDDLTFDIQRTQELLSKISAAFDDDEWNLLSSKISELLSKRVRKRTTTQGSLHETAVMRSYSILDVKLLETPSRVTKLDWISASLLEHTTLCIMYKKERKYWVLTTLLRRILLTMSVSFFSQFNAMRLIFVFSIFLISLLAHIWYKPFVRTSDNLLECLSLTVLVLTTFVSMSGQWLTSLHLAGYDELSYVVIIGNLSVLITGISELAWNYYQQRMS